MFSLSSSPKYSSKPPRRKKDMARSHISQYSPKVAKKARHFTPVLYVHWLTQDDSIQAFRSATREAGIRYVDAITALKQSQAQDKTLSNPTTRRNPGRMDGVRWNGDSFICARNVDGIDESDIHEPEPGVEEYELAVRRETTRTKEVCLLDIAKPMKARGVAKRFEVVRTVQRTIALDEEDFDDGSECWDVMSRFDDEESEWEEIFLEGKDEEKVEVLRPTYSAVLRENT
ncbi:hypothetical protein VNI00_004289 [Paramarasmius palmivorus]|uniref:Uncharacterized protein n=1 Tax=Paramarasmius palmivorus TaxID=297713 RepID=A0AAW0DPW3_9AGAR